MKKTLIAVAALSAMATSAMAAGVTVYGQVGQAIQFKSVKKDSTERSVTMESSLSGSPRFGFKGSEDLGNGHSVNFVLEGAIKGDTGVAGDGSMLFNRQTSLQVVGPYGSLQMGRFGGICGSSNGGEVTNNMGYSTVYGLASSVSVMFDAPRMSNMVSYRTPKLSGFQGTVEYSFGTDGTEAGNANNSNNYLGGAITYANGNLWVGAGAEQYHYATVSGRPFKADKTQVFSLSANYDFGSVKVFGGAQYGKHLRSVGSKNVTGAYEGQTIKVMVEGKEVPFTTKNFNAYAFTLGAKFNVAGGDLFAQGGYVKGTDKIFDNDVKAYHVGAGYKYPLSKRTYVYGTAGYAEAKFDEANKPKQKTFLGAVGVHHSF